MSSQAQTSKNDNAEKKFEAFQSQLDQISSSFRNAVALAQKSDDALFEALAATLELGLEFKRLKVEADDADWDLLKDFLEAHGERWSAKCEVSFYHGLAAVAFNQTDADGDPLISAPTLSRYRAVLRYAHEINLDGPKLVEKLKAKTVDGVYKDALSHFRYDPFERHIENRDVGFQRSVRHLYRNRKGMPEIAYTNGFKKPKSVSGFATAIVRVRSNKMQIVGFTDDVDDEDTMRDRVISMVPAEATRRRKKLSDQNLYWLYVTCDIYSRFLPKLADRNAWAKAAELADIPLINENSSDQDVQNMLARYSELGATRERRNELAAAALSEPNSALMKKFLYLDALEFSLKDGAWLARTISTHPNTPTISVIPPKEPSTSSDSWSVALQGFDAARFVDQFPRHEDWSVARENGLLRFSYADGKSDRKSQFVMQDMREVGAWRTADPKLTPVAEFSLDRQQLHALEHWRREFAETPRIGRKAFQSILRVEQSGGQVLLVQPLNSRELRPLGTMTSGSVPVFDEPRFFAYKPCGQLLSLALDYGTSFTFELLEGHEGLSAIRVRPTDFPIEATVTLPLLLSNKGNPAEITAVLK